MFKIRKFENFKRATNKLQTKFQNCYLSFRVGNDVIVENYIILKDLAQETKRFNYHVSKTKFNNHRNNFPLRVVVE